jgi:hypothetical protein
MGDSFPALGGSKAWRRGSLSAVAAAGLLLTFVDCTQAAFDFGSWNAVGAGSYLNGDAVTVKLGPNTGFYANTYSTSAIGAAFDQPGVGQYAHVANNIALASWSVTINLGSYHVSPQTVFAFANLGAGSGSGIQTASIVFRDGSFNPLSLAGATFLGSFPHQWNAQTFDDPASFNLSAGNLSAGTWSYALNGQNVEGASAIFFLTNVPTNTAEIDLTVVNPSNLPNYLFDSVFIAVGSPIPEPSAIVLMLSAITLSLRKDRGRRSNMTPAPMAMID